MKAVVVEAYGAIEDIALKEVPQPAPGPGQLRVRVEAVGIGFVDGLKVRGLYQTRDPLPFTPGTEFSGIVDALGPDVTGPAPGSAVIGMARSGGLAEYIVVPAASVLPMPAGIIPEVGASFFANYQTGL
jgi:NADPH2:quinone reductase